MAFVNPDRDRNTIPRWRLFRLAARLGELDSDRDRLSHDNVSEKFLYSRFADWEVHRTVGHAADLVGAAVTIGRATEAADVARFLLKKNRNNVTPWIIEIAERALGSRKNSSSQLLTKGQKKQRISRLRSALRVENRDPIACVDLSWLYTSLGLHEKARRYMVIALGLAPNSRFVLRSSCRLYVHLNELDRAHDVVVRAERTRHDPWLLAAEIATSGALSTSPRFFKAARQVLKDKNHSPRHLSELASGLATLELGSGSIKKSQRLFGVSLEAPTENSVAQAAWASRHGARIRVDERHLGVPNTFEARSWTFFVQGKWSNVVEECQRWSDDQPFSSRPTVLGSFVSAVALEDYAKSEELATDGLMVSPQDFVLLNNLAFSQINLGKFDQARKTLSRIQYSSLSEPERAVKLATQGLLGFRTDKLDQGRKLYQDALEIATHESDRRLYASAIAFFAMEEWTALGPERSRLVSEAIHALRPLDGVTFRLLEDRLRRTQAQLIDR